MQRARGGKIATEEDVEEQKEKRNNRNFIVARVDGRRKTPSKQTNTDD